MVGGGRSDGSTWEQQAPPPSCSSGTALRTPGFSGLRCPCSSPACSRRGGRGLSIGPGCAPCRSSLRCLEPRGWVASACSSHGVGGQMSGVEVGRHTVSLAFLSFASCQVCNVLAPKFPHQRDGATPLCPRVAVSVESFHLRKACI